MAGGALVTGPTLLPDPSPASVGVVTSPSLLAHLFAEASRGDRQAREALFLTFNVDLGFFETRLLGVTRAAGAAVTVVADAHVYSPDARAIRGAGTSYVVGLASIPGAFHPKVSILAGPKRALIGIGSGNVTVSGWHGNEELSTVIAADREQGCPTVVSELAAWLRSLPEHVSLGSLAIAGLLRTASELESLAADAPSLDTGHRLVTTSGSSILTQLPDGPTGQLALYAPFHDHRGAAFRALLSRYQPTSVRLAVQPGQTVLTPAVLVAAAEEACVPLTLHAAGAGYRHGKLIEATGADGTGWTLTGSPNLTGAALLRSLERGGNCEVGLVAELTGSLYPGTGGHLAAADIPIVKFRVPEAAAAPSDGAKGLPLLIEATLVEDQMSVELSRRAASTVIVQVSLFLDLPESYESVGEIAEGQQSAVLPVPTEIRAGSRVRVTVQTPNGPAWGKDVYLTDKNLVTRRARPSGHGQANAHMDPIELFSDLKQAERWQSALNDVLTKHPVVFLPRVASTAGGGSDATATDGVKVSSAEGWRTLNDPDAWAEYAEDAVLRLGEPIFLLAAGGLPRLVSNGPESMTPSTPIWIDPLSDNDSEFDDEHTAEELDSQGETASESPSRSQKTRTRQEQARYRRWLHRLAQGLHGAPAIDRSARVGLILIGTKVDLWEGTSGPNGWFDLLAGVTQHLLDPDIPDALLPQMASLAAVCVYRLDQAAPADNRGANAATYKSTVAAIRNLLNDATFEKVADNTASLDSDTDLPEDPSAVWAHRNAILDMDAHADTVRMLARAFHAWDVRQERPAVFVVQGQFSNCLKAACQAIALIDDFPTVAVRAIGSGEKEALVIRHEGTLTVINPASGARMYRTYRLDGLVNPVGIAEGGDIALTARLDPPPWNRPPNTALRALAAVDLSED